MNAISYKHHRFPAAVIQQAVWLYYRVTLSLWDVEDLLAERGVEVSYETFRRWVPKFGPGIARSLRCLRPRAHPQWYLDEMFVSIGGRRKYLWRAVDQDGEVLGVLVQARRDKRAGLKLMRKILKKHGFALRTIVTDKLRAGVHPHSAKWSLGQVFDRQISPIKRGDRHAPYQIRAGFALDRHSCYRCW